MAPDLVVEVLSPGDSQRDVLDRVGEYLQSGTRLVWLVDPVARTVTVYRSLSDVHTAGADETIEGGAVLPAFTCRLSELL